MNGYILQTQDQEVINPSGDVPKSTNSKDDARNSTTSDSNDVCAPPLVKGDFELCNLYYYPLLETTVCQHNCVVECMISSEVCIVC
jgi:hypothetical protein